MTELKKEDVKDIITNFIEYFSSDEQERKDLKEVAKQFLENDHVYNNLK